MPKLKFTPEFIQSLFAENGCKLLSEPVNGRIRVDYICSCGEEARITPYAFNSGTRCKKCTWKKIIKTRTYSQEFVNQIFLENQCELLDVYQNNATPMQYKCKCGNISKICLSSFTRGNRCNKCGIQKHSGVNHPRWNPDRESLIFNRKLRQKARNHINRIYASIGTKKKCRSKKLVGYSTTDLHQHLQKFKNWTDLQNKNWHIDHVFPIKAFLDAGIQDIALINCLDNLQPTEAHYNLSKNDRYCKEDFHRWLNQRGWFSTNGVFKKFKITPQGMEVSFYIPTYKTKSVMSELKKQLPSHTIENDTALGIWNSTTEDTNTKFMTCIPEESIGKLLKFLSSLCDTIQEQTIYVSVGSHGFLIFPNKGENT